MHPCEVAGGEGDLQVVSSRIAVNVDKSANILKDHNLCYYHSKKKYNYWKITDLRNDVFKKKILNQYDGCPFKDGKNQLWRNQLLGLAIEDSIDWRFNKVFFSDVYHPNNTYLEKKLKEYEMLISYNPRFSYFTSEKIINEVKDPHLKDWVEWYKSLYYKGEKNE